MRRRYPFFIAAVAGMLLLVGIVSLLDNRLPALYWAGKNRATDESQPSREAPASNAERTDKGLTSNAPAVHTLPSTLSPADFRLPSSNLQLKRDSEFGTPRFVGNRSGFLSPPAPGVPPEGVLRAFLEENGRTFTLHASDLLDPENAAKTRDVVTPHNGMRSVTWRQQHEGLEIFGAYLALNLTADNRIINIQSRALHVPSLRFHDEVNVTTEGAFAIAGHELNAQQPTPNNQRPTEAIWYPLDMITVVKAWDVLVEIFEQKETKGTKETHRVIVRADTGEIVENINLTWSLEPITLQVYTNDSPSAFSPGMDEPTNYIPPVLTQSVFSIAALNTNASPQGWVPTGANSSLGNNIDAYVDLLDDNQVDPGDRIEGPSYRDFTGLPNNSTSAVMQAFYWGNVFHDRLHALGFDEASGNFQQDNFGRGGRDADRLRVEVWNGAYQTPYGKFAQANMTVLNDGNPPRMQLYLWNRAADEFFNPHSPGMRDGALDAEVIFHEAVHGVSSRLIGDGYGLSTVQSRGMAEGWSDYMAMSLLAEPADDPHGVYAFGAYVAAWQTWSNNYYFGIRRFPYTTDMNKAPQTFADTDPNQIEFNPSIPVNPWWATTDPADQIHRIGEVWCLALWECRANLMERHGFAGNEMLLQLVVDGMKLTPENPSFLEARDAILQADLVNHGGTNQVGLWRGFAKRGLGWSATVPESHSTVGIREAFDLPFGINVMVAETGGDGDGYLEPGESGVLTVTLTSHEMGLGYAVGVLSTSNIQYPTPNIEVTGSNTVFGSISSGNVRTSAPPFTVDVAGDFPGNSNAWFTLQVASDQGTFSEPVAVKIGNPYDYPPEILDVAVTNVTETSAQVIWNTGLPADGMVEYGSTTNYGSSTLLDPIMCTNHMVELPGLTKGTEYHYRIHAEGTNGLTAVSGNYIFRTRARIYVNVNSAATQELGTIEAPYKTLQAAANAAQYTGDEILVAEGTYTGTDSAGVLVLVGSDWDLTIHGGYSEDFAVSDPVLYPTVIDCERQRRGILLDSGATLSVSGLTITRGNSEWGGGVSVRDAQLAADSCNLIDNASTNGVNQFGGALHASLGAQVFLSGCALLNNQASQGGGVFAASSDTVVLLSGCDVAGNNAAQIGGGVLSDGGSFVAIQDCLIVNNVSLSAGAGISVFPFSETSLAQSTVACNTVTYEGSDEFFGGGGIHISGPVSIGSLRVSSSVIFGNVGPHGADIHSEEGAEIYAAYSCIRDIYGSLTSSNSLIRSDPQFADPAAGDFHLLYGAPCIDTGDPDYSGSAFDMDGEPRPFGSAVDMGADEFTDGDGDNMADYWEIRHFESIEAMAGLEDTDSDGLSTFGEYMQQTDPHDTSTDGDGMPDGWEVTHGLNPKGDDAALDPDGDGMNNAAEYSAGTNPQDADSLLRLNRIYPDWGGVRIEWQGGIEAAQWLQSSSSITGIWNTIFAVPHPTLGTNAVIVFDPRPIRFYRIRASRE